MQIENKEKTNHTAINGVLVIEDCIENRRIREDDETKATRSIGGLVAHYNGLSNITILAKVVLKLVLRRIPRYSSYKQLPFIRIHLYCPE